MIRPRRPVTFWGMAVLFTLYSLFGVLVLVTAHETGGRVIGATIVMVFGFGGLAYLGGPALTRRGPETVQRRRVETATGAEPAFVFPSPRVKRRATAFGLSGIAVGVVGMLAVMGGGLFLFAGTALLCAIAGWSLVSLRRPQMVALTPRCVLVATPAATVEIPWTARVDAEIYRMPTGQAMVDMVGLMARDASGATWTSGRVIELASRQSKYVISIAADSFAGEGEDVVAAIRLYADDSVARARIGEADERDRLLRALGEAGPEMAAARLPAT